MVNSFFEDVTTSKNTMMLLPNMLVFVLSRHRSLVGDSCGSHTGSRTRALSTSASFGSRTIAPIMRKRLNFLFSVP